MKLYTEEQVRQMLFDLGDVLFNNCQNGIDEGEPELYFDNIIVNQTPIELPSDEDIEKNVEKLFYGEKKYYFKAGIEWMKQHILNQSK